MTTESKEPVRVPSPEELMATVMPRSDAVKVSKPEPVKTGPAAKPDKPVLSRKAEDFLLQVSKTPGRNQKELFTALGIDSGATQTRVIHALDFRYGFISRERRGRSYAVRVTEAGRAYLAEAPVGRKGVGGRRHKRCVAAMVRAFRRAGYTKVSVECEVGSKGKRVDIVAIGERRVGVEVGISSVEQEIRNLTLDLQSGALDEVLMVSPNRAFVAEVRRRAQKDPYLRDRLDRVNFFALDIEEPDL